MERVAVFVDAGYLYAGGAKSVSGLDGTKRHDITLNIAGIVVFLIGKAESISQQKLLRIYWYDAAPSSRLTTDHQILASSDNVKLRLGVINGFGEQKGVDGKIITDLAELSRNRAFSDAVLLGGDEDLRIGVELAQEFGSRVHLLTIEGSSSSPTLRQESDTVTVIAREEMQSFITVRAPSAPITGLALVASADATLVQSPLPSATPANSRSSTASVLAVAAITTPVLPSTPLAETNKILEAEIKQYLSALSSNEQVSLTAALKTGAGVPTEHDGRVLARTRKALGRPLDQAEKAKLRRTLKKELGL
jgi:uncharacterized LabA/DUF88 family protein